MTGAIATPTAAAASFLLEGEEVLWAGAPRQTPLVREDFLHLPLAGACMIGGLYVFGFVRISGHPRLVAISGLMAACLAAAALAWRLWGAPRRRRRTRYVVTQMRAMVIESGRYLSSYVLREGLEVARTDHRDGTASLHFGSPRASGQRDPITDYIPPDVRRFDHLQDGNAIYQLIRKQIARNSGNESQRTLLPMVRPMPTPFWQSALTDIGDVTADVLSYQQPFRQKLRPGEKTLWVGRPGTRMLIRRRDWPGLLIGVAILVFFWVLLDPLSLRWPNPLETCLAVVFLGVAMYIAVGRFFVEARSLHRTWYTLTTMRCLVVREEPIMQTMSLWPPLIQGVVLERAESGKGTIVFDRSATGRREVVQVMEPSFRSIDEAQSVHDLIVLWMQQRSRPGEPVG